MAQQDIPVELGLALNFKGASSEKNAPILYQADLFFCKTYPRLAFMIKGRCDDKAFLLQK